MKNFSTKKRLLASVAPALAVFAALFSSACDRVEQAELSPADPISMVDPATDLSAESVARMLSGLPLTLTQVREVFDGVVSSSSNGYDEEYPFANLLASPGSGVGHNCFRQDP